nr:L-threonylcarbamoyladenylate synthase [Phytoactinopolyspora alkaliphila]
MLYDCSDETKRTRGMGVAVRAIKAGRLVVLPTDTVYGIAADAFSPDAIAKLLAAKGRGPDMPVPVLVGSADAWTGVAVTNEAAEALAAVFWPGGLSLLCHEQPSLNWNLGDTGGTVVVRMPEDDVALELLEKTGPLGVSSANQSGRPPARSAKQARDQLGDSVAVYLESGFTAADVPSTIVDVTEEVPRVVRAGAISLERLREVVPEIIGPEDDEAAEDAAAVDAVPSDDVVAGEAHDVETDAEGGPGSEPGSEPDGQLADSSTTPLEDRRADVDSEAAEEAAAGDGHASGPA